MVGEQRTWLDVPYEQKDTAKAAGALWDWRARRWYAPRPGMTELARWVPAPRESPDGPAPGHSRPPPGRSVPTAGVWEDLALRRPGHEVLAEAARRGAGWDSSWRVGAEGEYLLDEALAGLTDPGRLARLLGGRETRRGRARWRVLHSVPVGLGHTDIDHVLIGPPGVITVNTKNHNPRLRVEITPDAMTVGGRRTTYLAAARHEADRARTALRAGAHDLVSAAATGPVGSGHDRTRLAVWGAVAAGHRVEIGPGAWPPVTPAVAVIGPPLRGHGRPAGVLVTTPKTLPRLLSALPDALDEPQATAVYELARRSSTWVREL